MPTPAWPSLMKATDTVVCAGACPARLAASRVSLVKRGLAASRAPVHNVLLRAAKALGSLPGLTGG
jgi:hypothetical protein